MAAGGMADTRLASVGDGVALKEQEKKLKNGKSCIGDSRLESSNWTLALPKDWSNLSFPTSNLQCRTFQFLFFTRLGLLLNNTCI